MSQFGNPRPTISLSKRTLIIVGVILLAAIVLFFLPRPTSQNTAIFTPAQHAAQGLATMDIYLRPDDYKSDLTWSAYQQILALSPQYLQQNAKEPYSATFVKYGAQLLLDEKVFGDSVNALVQVYVKNKSGVTILMEFQLKMIPEGKEWKIDNVVTLVKGEVPANVTVKK